MAQPSVNSIALSLKGSSSLTIFERRWLESNLSQIKVLIADLQTRMGAIEAKLGIGS